MKDGYRIDYAAENDLLDIFHYYVNEAGRTVAYRFLDYAEATFKKLVYMPGMGSVCESSLPALAGLRLFPVSGFEKYLIYYRPVKGGIDIVRVLHSARDIPEILKPI